MSFPSTQKDHANVQWGFLHIIAQKWGAKLENSEVANLFKVINSLYIELPAFRGRIAM